MPPFTSLARHLVRTAKRSQIYPYSAAAGLTHLFSGDLPRLAGGLSPLPTPAFHLLSRRSNAGEFGFPSAAGLRQLSYYRSKPGTEKEHAESPPGEESVSGRSPAIELDGFWNLPNSISLARLASGPLLGCMIMNEWYLASFFGLAVAGISDWLDGFVARKMGINSVVGSYLDPLADKVLICCVAVSMVGQGLLHPGLVLLVVLRDVGLVGAAVYKRASTLGWQWKSWSEFVNLNRFRPEKVEPLFISKVNTVLQLALVAGALLQPVFGTEETQFYVTNLSWLVATTTVVSTVAYGIQHTQKAYVFSAKP